MKHIKNIELHCKCGKCKSIEPVRELKAILNLVRDKYDSPLIITSGYRCKDHNRKVGGAKRSQHLKGTAADFYVVGIEPEEIYEWLNDLFPNDYGLALGKGFIHLDVRHSRARWNY